MNKKLRVTPPNMDKKLRDIAEYVGQVVGMCFVLIAALVLLVAAAMVGVWLLRSLGGLLL